MRIGLGEDIHRLEVGLPLLIGGIKIESELGAIAHSDGDVLLHAITDAIYGALAKKTSAGISQTMKKKPEVWIVG